MLNDINIMINIDDNLSDTQKKAFELFKNNKNLLILGAGGVGKCLKKGTGVIMYDGSIKKIEDICVGELIMGDDSTPRKVLNTTNGRDIMYEVKNTNNESYIVNSHHILSLKYCHKKSITDRKTKNDYIVHWFNNKTIKIDSKCFSYKNKNKRDTLYQANKFLESIIEDRYVDISIQKYNELKGIKKYLYGYSTSICFKEKLLNFDPYIIGLWLGNGSSINTNINVKDYNIIQYLKKQLSKYNSSFGMNKSTNYFKQQLITNNLLNNKHIPMIYKCNSRINQLKLLAGILDSCGFFKNKSYKLLQQLQYEKLIDDIIYLCRSLGFVCYKTKEIKKTGDMWCVSISGYGLEEIPVLCQTKKAIPKKHINDITITNITVTKLEYDDYYGFELDGNHRFVLSNFIVTHNSHLIKLMKEHTENNTSKHIYLCSTTGISAYNIGGMTIHSFMGLGTGDMDINLLVKKIYKKKLYRDRILNTDILIIDEISMLSGELFEKINIICQEIRKNKNFFGGIQLIISGDFLQLLPVFNKNKNILNKIIDERLIIETNLFQENFTNNNIILLKENFRQNDNIFISLLNRIRTGTFTQDDIDLLNTRKINTFKDAIHLVSSNKKAKMMNDSELLKLQSSDIKYEAIYTSSGKNKELKELLMNELQFQFNQKGIHELIIKIDSRVMLIKNLDVSKGLVNGALGTVKNIIYDNNTNKYIPLVLFDQNNIEQLIHPVTWELEMDNCIATASQIPLMLAYSITIHKSQSLTLDNAVLDLEDCFCDHQIYVALSRLRSLNGLYLKSFNPLKITINQKMNKFIQSLD